MGNFRNYKLTESNMTELRFPFSTLEKRGDVPSSGSSGTGDGWFVGMYTTRNLHSSITFPGSLLNCKLF